MIPLMVDPPVRSSRDQHFTHSAKMEGLHTQPPSCRDPRATAGPAEDVATEPPEGRQGG
jgi:hypothetical protein